MWDIPGILVFWDIFRKHCESSIFFFLFVSLSKNIWKIQSSFQFVCCAIEEQALSVEVQEIWLLHPVEQEQCLDGSPTDKQEM